jgi:bifunctional DNase/RNase
MAEMVPVTITGIVREHVSVTDPRERFYIRLESAADGDSRRLDIGVGDTEAASLGFTLQGALFRRPMTYQFMASLIEAAGSTVRSVLVTKMTDGIFYAQVTLCGGAVVDARPSDAINLAAVTGAPVSVASDLLELPTEQHPQPTR